MVKRGFTIVELIIVITIMGILLVLGVVNLNSSQANARDAERKSDVETIATALESFYNSGYTSKDNSQKTGQYPSTADLLPDPTNIIKDTDTKALQAPSTTDTLSLIAATSNNTTESSIATDINKYVYQPLQSDGSLCDDSGNRTTPTQECRKFNIYYKTETIINGTTAFKVSSRHQ
jgi:prepilin-type N-terminal cleavage/methylation domain-containing protein